MTVITAPECSDFNLLIFKGPIQRHTWPPKLHFVFTRMHNLRYLNMSKYTYTSRNYSKSWMSIRHRMSQKALLNTSLQRPITFHYCLPAAPNDNSETTDNKQTLINKDNLTLRRLMSYIYGAPILDVSRSHTTTQHSR